MMLHEAHPTPFATRCEDATRMHKRDAHRLSLGVKGVLWV